MKRLGGLGNPWLHCLKNPTHCSQETSRDVRPRLSSDAHLSDTFLFYRTPGLPAVSIKQEQADESALHLASPRYPVCATSELDEEVKDAQAEGSTCHDKAGGQPPAAAVATALQQPCAAEVCAHHASLRHSPRTGGQTSRTGAAALTASLCMSMHPCLNRDRLWKAPAAATGSSHGQAHGTFQHGAPHDGLPHGPQQDHSHATLLHGQEGKQHANTVTPTTRIATDMESNTQHAPQDANCHKQSGDAGAQQTLVMSPRQLSSAAAITSQAQQQQQQQQQSQQPGAGLASFAFHRYNKAHKLAAERLSQALKPCPALVPSSLPPPAPSYQRLPRIHRDARIGVPRPLIEAHFSSASFPVDITMNLFVNGVCFGQNLRASIAYCSRAYMQSRVSFHIPGIRRLLGYHGDRELYRSSVTLQSEGCLRVELMVPNC